MEDVAASEQELWEVYYSSPLACHRDKLVEYYSGFARKMALNVYMARAKNSEVSFEDCLGVALLELLGCIERFDIKKSSQFTTYSYQRIRGAVHDYISSSCERLSIASFHHNRSNGRTERFFDLTADIDEFEGLVIAVLDISTSHYLDECANYHESEVYGSPYADPRLDVFRTQIREVVDMLGDPDSVIIFSHYFKYQPFAEIAAMLGLTPARISQLHKRALGKLRSLLG